MLEPNKIYCWDCLEFMKDIQDWSIDAIITDPPYWTTACKWDTVIPFEPMWEQLKRIIKPNGAIVLFGSEPFSSALRMSNIKMYKYDWKWIKNRTVWFLNAKNAPLKKNEDILVFSKWATANNNKNRMVYYPQWLIEINKIKKSVKQPDGTIVWNRPSRNNDYVSMFEWYPSNILEYKNETKQIHPTQKPIALMEYLIKTYTNEWETVLDFTCGSGSTLVWCKNLNRNFIGIEKEQKYVDIANKRLENTTTSLF